MIICFPSSLSALAEPPMAKLGIALVIRFLLGGMKTECSAIPG